MGRLLVAVVLVGVLPTLVAAGDKEGWVYGLGTKTCETWLAKRESHDHFDMAQWMLGYISAAGYYGPSPFGDHAGESFIAWLDYYCQAHPLESFPRAVRTLIQKLALTEERGLKIHTALPRRP
jgi:hypothetical protein